MGCAGSKPSLDLSVAQPPSEFLIQEMGRVSRKMDVTTSAALQFERMVPGEPILLQRASGDVTASRANV